MAEPFLGEIRLFSMPFAPKGWHFCDGTILQIAQNQALYAILGTTYGGNGTTTFALPDLRGRVPVHAQGQVALGESAGETAHTLTVNEMPMHNHMATADSASPTSKLATGNTWGTYTVSNMYSTTSNVQMSPSALSSSGGSQPHNNMQPYIVVNFCIATAGIFPSRG